MLDVAALERALPVPAAAGEPTRISCAGIVTRDRLPQLKRCVASLLRHLRQHGRDCVIAVCDDSRHADPPGAGRDLLLFLARRSGVRIGYAGPAEKAAYIGRLVARGIPLETARFALTGPLDIGKTPGANRNALLLHCAGTAFLSCDDDSVCAVHDLRDGDQSAVFVDRAGIADRTWFPAVEPRPGRGHMRSTRDLIAAHEELLGKSMRELVFPVRNTAALSAAALGGRILSDLLEGSGRVAVTASGVRGDSGLPHAAPFLMATGQTRIRFLQAWAAGGWNAARNVIIGPDRPLVSRSGPLATTTATGFDHRGLLPPFAPAGLGEDTLFGSMLSRCVPGAYIGYVPAAILHVPADRRVNGPLPAAPRLVDVLGYFLHACPDSIARSPEQRLRHLGRHLADCGRASATDFQAYLLRLARQARVTAVEGCERLLEAFRGEPAAWAEEMERWIASIERGLTDRAAACATELPANDLDRAYERMREYVRKFGDLLEWWPEMVRVAQDLTRAGESLCRLVGT